MHLAICDDDMLHLNELSQMLTECRSAHLPFLRWSVFQTGFSLLTALEESVMFDAYILDIFIGDLHGMTLAKTIRSMDPSTPIVFLTNSSDFAVESYDVDASGYLLKPLSQERLNATLKKINDRHARSERDGIVVRCTDGMMTRVQAHNIMYLEAHGHFSILYSSNGTTIKTAIPVSVLAKQFDSFSNFAQAHRSFLVNLGFVHRIGESDISLLNGTIIPLSRGHSKEFKQRFMDTVFVGGQKS